VYEVQKDGRRREARNSKVKDLEVDSEMLHQLMDAIRSDRDDHLHELLSKIRNAHSMDDMKTSIRQHITDRNLRQNRNFPPNMPNLHRGEDSNSGDSGVSSAQLQSTPNSVEQVHTPPVHGPYSVVPPPSDNRPYWHPG
jgi:hypothetical protein